MFLRYCKQREMITIYKKILAFFMVAALCTVLSQSIAAQTLDILFEHRTRTEVSRGITYESKRLMTANGMLDVHVLLVDLNDPYINIGPVHSDEIGRRETTTNLLESVHAIAGINAEYFGMAGPFSTHFGTMIQDGTLIGHNASINRGYNEYATFFLDNNNNPFFRYLRSNITFTFGNHNIDIAAFNSIGHSLEWPVVIDNRFMSNTSEINERFEDLTYVVIRDQRIQFVSLTGETVAVPDDGYVVVLPPNFRRTYHSRMHVGQSARIQISNNLGLNFNTIQSSISGGGLLLNRGETVNDTGIVPSGRQPRSAVGTSRDGRTMILMTVDGRSHSIGASHNELAGLMRSFGAYHAMHLDGGGSATIAAQNADGQLHVLNRPSDGGQRRVINALGVFDDAPEGPVADLSASLGVDRIVVGVPMHAQVHGLDSWGNRVAINNENLLFFSVDQQGGVWNNQHFLAVREGEHHLQVWYEGFITNFTVTAYELAELQIRPAAVNILEEGRTALSFAGVSTYGDPVPIPSVARLTVTPTDLGYFDGNTFIATRSGAGFISATVGSTYAHIPVSVGGFARSINMHNQTANRTEFLGIPASVEGFVATQNVHGRLTHRLDYTFTETRQTQAAYLTFNPPLTIEGEPIALRLDVLGDGSSHWLRARVRDGNGTHHNIDFTRNADFTDWTSLIAYLPDAPAPFTLDRIYMVTLSAEETSHHRVFFSNLEALYPVPEAQRPTVPTGNVFRDPLRTERNFGGFAGGGVYEFVIPSGDAPVTYHALRWSEFAAITMTASGTRGVGIGLADRAQWGLFMNDIRRFDARYVAILLDENPMNFTSAMEFELLHLAMLQLRDEGRQVFVVSATGDETVLNLRDGIRYIDVAQPQMGIATIRFFSYNNQAWWTD